MITAGDTFLIPTPPDYKTKHLYVVVVTISDEGEVLLVNITTKNENSDNSCVLNIGDHTFIDRESVINYKDAIKPKIKQLDDSLTNGTMVAYKPVTKDLLDRIIKGALNSEFLRDEYKKIIPQ